MRFAKVVNLIHRPHRIKTQFLTDLAIMIIPAITVLTLLIISTREGTTNNFNLFCNITVTILQAPQCIVKGLEFIGCEGY
jgi:hypothetical protein